MKAKATKHETGSARRNEKPEQDQLTEGKTAVCVGAPNGAKNAALFFDNIWHLCPTFESAPRAVFPEGFNHDRALRDRFLEFTYNLALTHPESPELFEQAFTIRHSNKPGEPGAILPKNTELIYRMIEESYINNVNGIRDSFLQLVGPLSPIHPIPVISKTRSLEVPNKTVGDIAVTLSNLQIVDVANTPWEQIVEFRKDAESAKALRQLRVFLYENCRDKSSSYIEDKIQSELDKYHNAVKSHGFKLVTGSLSTLIDSKSIIAASSAGLVATLIGGPITGVTTAVALEVGKLAIQISKDLYTMKELKRDHALAYIIKASDELT